MYPLVNLFLCAHSSGEEAVPGNSTLPMMYGCYSTEAAGTLGVDCQPARAARRFQQSRMSIVCTYLIDFSAETPHYEDTRKRVL